VGARQKLEEYQRNLAQKWRKVALFRRPKRDFNARLCDGAEAQPTGMPGLTSASGTDSRDPLTDNSKTKRHFFGCGSETGVGSPGY
jgi:hypothetical protein